MDGELDLIRSYLCAEAVEGQILHLAAQASLKLS